VKRACLALVFAAALVRADSLEAVLGRIDQAARTFKSLATDVHRVDYSSLFNESKPEDGTFKMLKRAKTGVVLLAEFRGADARKISLAGHTATVYHPKANSADEYDTRKFTKSADLLVLVGFGTSRADLEKKYTITLGGSETIAATKTTRIDLVPKSKEERNFFNMVQLWVPENKGNPIQEKFLTGKESKDYNMFLFSNLQINPSLPDSDFELVLPPNVKVIKP